MLVLQGVFPLVEPYLGPGDGIHRSPDVVLDAEHSKVIDPDDFGRNTPDGFQMSAGIGGYLLHPRRDSCRRPQSLRRWLWWFYHSAVTIVFVDL